MVFSKATLTDLYTRDFYQVQLARGLGSLGRAQGIPWKGDRNIAEAKGVKTTKRTQPTESTKEG